MSEQLYTVIIKRVTGKQSTKICIWCRKNDIATQIQDIDVKKHE